MTHRQLFINTLRKEKSKSILDVGCGFGQDLVLIKKKFPKIRIVGIDASPDRVREAKEVLGDTKLILGYASELPFKDKSFDISFTDAVLMMGGYDRAITILKEMKRVSKNKIFLIETHSGIGENSEKFLEYNVRNYQVILSELGFKNIQFTKITKEVWPGWPWEYYGFLISADI